MTIRQIADVAGCDIKTVRKFARTMYPEVKAKKNGLSIDYDKTQSIAIMERLPKRNNVEYPSEFQGVDLTKNGGVDLTKNGGVDYEMIGKMIALAVSSALQPLVNQLSAPVLQLENKIKEDYFTLTAYCNLHGISANRSELALHGKELRKLTLDKNMELKQVPDERWGKVNSYPVVVLDEYFTV